MNQMTRCLGVNDDKGNHGVEFIFFFEKYLCIKAGEEWMIMLFVSLIKNKIRWI